MTRARTIVRIWQEAVAADRASPAYLVKDGREWRPMSWQAAAERVELYANGLLARGISKGDAFAILARTTVEWALFDFALAHVGAVTAPIYATSSARDARYVIDHSEAIGVLCEDDEQVAKVDAGGERPGRLREVLTFRDLDALAREGADFRATSPTALAEAAAAIGEDDLFTFIYTSGTTGPPKGCMISHRNYYEMASVVEVLPGYMADDDVTLLYLPLAHNFGRLVHLAGPLTGNTIAFEPDPYAVADDLPVVRPTVLPSVPRVYEKVHGAVLGAFDEATGPRRRLVEWALGVGRRVGRLRMDGAPVPRHLALQHRLADRLVYGKVKARLGGRLRLPISGGAPLSREIAEFFDALDVRIYEGYGLTECTSACTANTPEAYRYGTVGKVLPGAEVRLAEDGELLTRSATVFQGYYKDPDATAAILDGDGWLHTGDIATISGDGFVSITDRKKDIIVTAGGKNVAPQNIENDLKASKYVSQALVVGDRRPYVSALITLDPVEVPKWGAERGLSADLEALAREPQVRDLLQEVVDQVNRERSRFEQIKRFAVLPRDFSPEEGEVTPTLKLKRRVVLEHFADTVDELYESGPPTRDEQQAEAEIVG